MDLYTHLYVHLCACVHMRVCTEYGGCFVLWTIVSNAPMILGVQTSIVQILNLCLRFFGTINAAEEFLGLAAVLFIDASVPAYAAFH